MCLDMLCPWLCVDTGSEGEFRFTKATHKMSLFSQVWVFFSIGGAVAHFRVGTLKSIFDRKSIHFHTGDHNRLQNLHENYYLLYDY